MELEKIEVLESECNRIEQRRADIVVKVQQQEKISLLHVEIQNNNDTLKPLRMLRYRTDIELQWPNYEVEQYLIYIGKEKLSMQDNLEKPGLIYNYQIVDMHDIDCDTFIKQDNPDALILSILCDFKGKDEREVIQYILQRLKILVADNDKAFRDYLTMLEILSSNRNLKIDIKEEEKMLSMRLDELPSYEIGFEQGVEKGIEKGIEKEKLAIAKKLMKNMDVNTVAEITGLAIEQLSSIK